MICAICKRAETEPGSTTVTLERDGSTLVIKDVPAAVCPNCGEAYIGEAESARLLEIAEALHQAGAQVDVRRFAAAS
ncbi:type II toxin-antitoxin system MqsA family antitoxin [Tautonia marina]|uniref:type II toxin-antitoxin system MqsA family antitoxin n=1 Tax=Tautonia marina TaxID=2653855 RepID=UPI00126125E3|nr:type II toxin-antitoxin system MqsA family antitoxin [Tautonia marina]